ncbi:MAG: hypothetical protein PHQ11_05575 [Paludibacter sp.]|nr:hypothetical protein [Paludibacter sp.]MDD4198985.1 hypothetical protein [Paludibacter sp.]MDD4426825.1 hypothetical protein [Paludibacter sp.]
MKCLIKSILLFLGIILFFSCQSQLNIVGKYTVIQRGKYPKVIPVTHYITLNNDSTFNYHYQPSWYVKKVSFGNWKRDKDNKRIIINSFIQDIRNIPIVVTETKNNNNSFLLFVFDNPLKSDTSVKWTLNVNDIDYPLNSDSLVLNKGMIVDSFYLTGYISPEDSTYRVPFPLQDTIESEKYNIKNSNNNVYHIAFPVFVDYNIFYYKPLKDSLKLNKNGFLFEGMKLKKK